MHFTNWYKRVKYLRAGSNKPSKDRDWWNWRFALDMFMANYYERNVDPTKQSEHDIDEIPWNDETESIMRQAFGFWIRTIPNASPYKTADGTILPEFKKALQEHATINYGFDPFDDESDTVSNWIENTKEEGIPSAKELDQQWSTEAYEPIQTPSVEELEQQWNPKGKRPGV